MSRLNLLYVKLIKVDCRLPSYSHFSEFFGLETYIFQKKNYTFSQAYYINHYSPENLRK